MFQLLGNIGFSITLLDSLLELTGEFRGQYAYLPKMLIGFAGSKIRPATAKNNKQQYTPAVLVTSCAYNSDGEDGDGSAG